MSGFLMIAPFNNTFSLLALWRNIRVRRAISTSFFCTKARKTNPARRGLHNTWWFNWIQVCWWANFIVKIHHKLYAPLLNGAPHKSKPLWHSIFPFFENCLPRELDHSLKDSISKNCTQKTREQKRHNWQSVVSLTG